jgi:hypothetical protein
MKMTRGHGRLRRPAVVAVALMAGVASVACAEQDNASTEPGGGEPTAETTEGVDEVAAPIGQPVEVAGLTATVTEVARQASFGDAADAGYIVASVSVVNDSRGTKEYHRLHFRLRKPDGSSINRTPIAGVNQLGNGELEPGERVEGQLIFMVEQAAGQFAITFTPPQTTSDVRTQGVWSFESTPGDAR